MDQDILYYTEASKNYAVVTICTNSFIPGTMVMIYSYLKYNTWYKGDFIILVEEITEDMKKFLAYLPNVKFHKVGQKVLDRAETVTQNDQSGKIFKSHFYSLELFNISGYKKLFYVDSDMVILGNLMELFAIDAPMICVGDSFFYKDQLRDPKTYNLVKPKMWESKNKYWGDNFNAGLILFDESMATSQNYENLTEMIRVDGYSSQAMRLQDQMIQNIYFRGQYTLVSSKYNYRLGIAKQEFEKDNIRLEDAIVIHYTARKKPWLFKEALSRSINNKNYIKPFMIWQHHWTELLEQLNENHAS